MAKKWWEASGVGTDEWIGKVYLKTVLFKSKLEVGSGRESEQMQIRRREMATAEAEAKFRDALRETKQELQKQEDNKKKWRKKRQRKDWKYRRWLAWKQERMRETLVWTISDS
jgi:hypothetical protein